MSERRAFLDASPGERRGVVTLDGLPERLWIERAGEAERAQFGARHRGRIVEVLRDAGLAYVDIGVDPRGVMKLGGTTGHLNQGASVEVEVIAESRGGKGPAVRFMGSGAGRPELIAAAPDIEERLAAAAPGAPVIRGAEARDAADDAQASALEVFHQLSGGVTLAIEATRALVAIDVDFADQAGTARKAMDANLRAVRQAARLLRLKAIGGTVVIDLIGFPQHPAPLQEAARAAFAADQPGVSVLPVSRLGLLQIAKPHRETPLTERLVEADGRLSARTIAQDLVRALERQGAADPLARPVAACSTEVAALVRRLVAELGPRFGVTEELGWTRLKTDIRFT